MIAPPDPSTERVRLAQYNVARLKRPLAHPAMAELRDGLERVNRVARRAPGFVWMREGDHEHPGCGHLGFPDDPLLMPNLSVWTSPAAFRRFVFDTVHRRYLARKHDWFEPADGPYLVAWFIPPDAQPSLAEAIARLDELRNHGRGPGRFDWAALDALTDQDPSQ